jgi:hypothetical protein
MRLLSAFSLGSTGKEAVPLIAAWNGYQHVLKGRFHRGTSQLRKAATAAEAFPLLLVAVNALSARRARRHNKLVPRNCAFTKSPMG